MTSIRRWTIGMLVAIMLALSVPANATLPTTANEFYWSCYRWWGGYGPFWIGYYNSDQTGNDCLGYCPVYCIRI